MKDKRGKTVLNSAFIEIVHESKCKPNKLWIDRGKELYKKLMPERLENNILMYSIHDEDNSVIAKRLIKTLKAKT